MKLKVVIAGPRGKMGAEVVKMMKNEPNTQIVAFLDHKPTELIDNDVNIPVFTNGETCFNQINAHILVDFTNPEASLKYMSSAITHRVSVISGTTGFADHQLEKLKIAANKGKIGCIVAPNFALGAVLMMEFAKRAAQYFPNVEI